MKYYFVLSLVFISLNIATSCKTAKIEKPVETYAQTTLTPKPSVISFTTQTKIEDIQSELNHNITGLIYEDNSLENNGGDNLMVKAWKQDDIQLDLTGNVLSYKIPLKLWIKAGFNIQKFGITLSDYRELNGALALKFKTSIILNPDWTVTTKTVTDGYEWLTTPVVKLGTIEMSVKFIADVILQASLKKMGGEIDESIKEYLNLKPYAQKAWDIAIQPIELNKQYNMWLQITPQNLISSPLTGINGVIKHKSAVVASVKVSVGGEPLPPVTRMKLPSLLIGEIPTDKVSLYAYIDIPYAEINKTALSFLKGKSFQQGKKKVIIEDIRIYGSGGVVVAETKLSGSLNGTIYFKGKPGYNPIDSTIIIKDFDYDLSTKNFLVKSASWLYQETFKHLIEKQLKWSISSDLIMTRSTLNTTLKSYKLSNGIILNGVVNHIEPGMVYITQDGILCEIVADGKLGIDISRTK